MPVAIHNKLAHSVSVSVTNPDGTLRELKLAAGQQSEALADSAINEHVRNLASQGHIKLRVIRDA